MSVIKPTLQHPELISYFLGANNYCWLHFRNGEKKLLAKPISHLEQSLPSFVRIHKTVLINPAYVTSLHEPPHKKKSGKVCLDTGEEFPVSRRRWPVVAEALQNHSGITSDHEATVTDNETIVGTTVVVDDQNLPAPSISKQPQHTITKTIFLITDDIESGFRAGQMIEERWPGYQLYVAKSSASLPDYLRHLGKSELPALLLLDARTTMMERFGTLQYLKQDKQLSHIPVVMLVLPTNKFVANSYQQQANSVVSMPVIYPQFGQTIERICYFWLSLVSLPGKDRYV